MNAHHPRRDDFSSALSECALVRSIYHFDEIGSTSDFAKDLIARSNGAQELHGTVVIANYQTSGRGRFQRQWSAPAGRGLLFSLIVQPNQLRNTDSASLTADWLKTATAVGFCSAVAAVTGMAVRIKYPNDLMVEEKKIAGMLLETVRSGGNKFTVIGIGLNVNMALEELPADTRIPAGSLALIAGHSFHIPEVLKQVMDHLQRWFYEHPVSLAAERMALLCDTIGKFVEIKCDDRTFNGLAIGISEDGGLVVRSEAGTQQVIYSGDIKQLAAAG